MLRSAALCKLPRRIASLATIPNKLAFNAALGSFQANQLSLFRKSQKLVRPFSSGNDDDPDSDDLYFDGEIEIDDLESDLTSGQNLPVVKATSYKFYPKTIALVFNHVIFPYTNNSVPLTKYHAKLFKSQMPLFVTCIYRKDPTQDKVGEDLLKSEEGQKKLEDGKSVEDEFHPVGTYCWVEYDQENSNNITLHTIHRVDLKGVKEFPLAYEEEADLNQFSDVLTDLDQRDKNSEKPKEKPKEEVQNYLQPQEQTSSMRKYLHKGYKELRKKTIPKKGDEVLLHIADISMDKMEKIELTIEQRMLIQNIVDIAN